MIYRALYSIVLMPIWLLLSIVMTIMYAIAYIKGPERVAHYHENKKDKTSGIINEYDEFNIHAN